MMAMNGIQADAGVIIAEERLSQNSRSRYLDKTSVLIYLSHFLSSFGDRVWHFAVGLYLYHLYPCSLMLTAVYGLATCGALFLLGAPVGRWVDKTKRLNAARISIVIQNAAVLISATVMAATIYYKQEIAPIWNGKLEILLYAVIIIVEVIAELSSMANKLVLEKDWIVVLARGDKQKLSYLNATMRTINLSCKILAPFVVGHLLEWFSYVTGAIFMACWNVISAFVEFYLLQVIFAIVPELSKRKSSSNYSRQSKSLEQINRLEPQAFPGIHQSLEKLEKSAVQLPPAVPHENADGQNQNNVCCLANGNGKEDLSNNNNDADAGGFKHLGTDFKEISLITPPKLSRASMVDANGEKKCTRADGDGKSGNDSSEGKLCQFCHGWKVYFSHPVKYAGLGLASLYMTVLCFDNISIGYLSSQGVSSGLSGNITALAALIGILGSLSFPYVRSKLGKNKAGIVGFGLETVCLLVCVVSIVGPGSPFDPGAISRVFDRTAESSCRNKNDAVESLSLSDHWKKNSNIFLLVIGITFARYGLWVKNNNNETIIADLSVTQIFQEKVHESERGVMGGVQGSFNQLMSLLKASLTILLPYPEQFGYLICLSWLFVFIGSILFMIFVVKDEEEAKASNEERRQEIHEQT